jgi:hypothetical protein
VFLKCLNNFLKTVQDSRDRGCVSRDGVRQGFTTSVSNLTFPLQKREKKYPRVKLGLKISSIRQCILTPDFAYLEAASVVEKNSVGGTDMLQLNGCHPKRRWKYAEERTSESLH